MTDDVSGWARRLTQAYLGLDELHRRAQPDDRWGLVVLNLSDLAPSPLADFDEAREVFQALQAEAGRLPVPDRREYYGALCGSALGVIAWNTRPLSLAEQIDRFLAAPTSPAGPEALEGLRTRIHTALGSLGYEGGLTERARAWEDRHRVPPEAIVETMRRLIDEARERCEGLFGPIECANPVVKLVRDAQFNARCDYTRLTIEINQDPILTLPGLKHLALHEVFPGHCLQFEWRQRAVREGWGFADGLLSLVKSAGSPLFEGLADIGGHLLDWEDPDDHVQALLSRYQAGLGTVASSGLHERGWTVSEAADYLQRNALGGGVGWVQNRLAYIAPAGRGAHIWSYWLGEQRLRELVPRRPDPATLRFLYGRMHSLSSVALRA